MLLALFAAAFFSMTAHSEPKGEFTGSAGVRLAEPTTHGGPASQRFMADGEQKFTFAPAWSSSVSGLFWYENAYFVNYDAYPGALREKDSREIRIQNAFLDFKGENFSVRAGNQIVVWGETFGVAYADVLNPKDLRELLPIGQSAIRRGIPIINVKYVKTNYTIQGIFIPRPEFNVLPLPGSDYAPARASELGFREILIERELRAREVSWETGGRCTMTLESMDLSAFFFDHFDRNPYYKIEGTPVPGGTLRVREDHERIRTLGFSAAKDLSGYVVRLEWVSQQGRRVPIIRGGTLDDALVDEAAGVASLDFPTWRSINFSLQGSSSVLNTDYRYLLRDRVETFGGLRASTPVLTSSSVDFIWLQSITDGSMRLQSEIMIPLRSNLELRLGADVMSGASDSTFGRLEDASRLYVIMRTFWDGFKTSKKFRQYDYY